MIQYFLVGCVAGALALALYIRLAPLHASVQHAVTLPVGQAGQSTGVGSHTVIMDVADGAAFISLLDDIIMATPRTRSVAGKVAEGRVTYVTRSRVMAFPDFTTVAVGPDNKTLTLHGRLRFGKSDMGVNRARIENWLAQLNGDTQ
jgi:hypothetical protein